VSLDADPRWRRFNDASRRCACCGQTFAGVYDIAYDHPDCWPHGHFGASGLDRLTAGDDFIDHDLCRFEEFRFVRCLLPLPIRGSDAEFCFGVWSSLSDENFDRYAIHVGDLAWDGPEAMFGWLSNDLPGYETDDSVPCSVRVKPGKARPRLWAQSGALLEAQRDGISFDTLLDI
jgi:hypothetical protein